MKGAVAALLFVSSAHGFMVPVPLSRMPVLMSKAVAPPAATAAAEGQQTLSEDAKQLLSYLRSHRKIYWDTAGWSAQAALLCKKCDTAGIYISDKECETNSHLLPGREAAAGIAKNAAEIVEKAWEATAAKYSAFKGEESDVAKMLKTDLKCYLRVISYGVAAANTEFLRDEHIEKQKELYELCDVEPQVVKYGIEQLKAAAKSHLGSGADKANACFDALAQRFA